MYRLINYLFGLTLIYLFILEGVVEDHIRIFIALCLASLVACFGFFANWISLDATKAVIILGSIVLGFGGWILAGSVIFFFAVSSILTRGETKRSNHEEHQKPISKKRRDGYQIWANGFWVAVFCILWFTMGTVASLVAAFAAVAAATADTWATELGTLNPGKTWLITTFESVESGTDGGVSLKGTIAAVIGAAFISLFFVFTDFVAARQFAIIIWISGIFGCFLDSIVGAIFLKKDLVVSPPNDFSSSSNSFTNSFINWMSTGYSGLLAFILTQLFFI